ncbi:MAG: AMP-binding protein, partial [Caulobacteraceae bacterium]|nr:AMP-binding protein [Caulobacteraceae bacterium]
MVEHTIGEALSRAARRWPDGEALVSRHQGIRWTWAELDRRCDDLAAGLVELGLRTGDRVGMWGPNSAEWTLTQFATARLGLILV